MEEKISQDLGAIIRICIVNSQISEKIRERFLLYELNLYSLRKDGKKYRYGRFYSQEEDVIAECQDRGLINRGFSFKKKKGLISITKRGEMIIGKYNPKEDLEKIGFSF
jgi:hypothetical protein